MRIAILISALFLVTSCTRGASDPSASGVPAQSQDTPQTAAQGPSYAETINTASAKIKNTPEFENCMQPSVNMCLTQVGNELARKNKSIELCSELPGENAQEACRFGIIMTEASASGNKAVCDKLTGDYKDSCITSITMQIARTSGNISTCDSLSSASGELISKKDQCYTMVISQKPDAVSSDCKVITSARERSICESLLSTRPN